MQIYKYRTTVTTAGGSGSANTNPIVHGLLRQVYINASTSTTIFRATLTDEDSDVVLRYDWNRGEINDLLKPVPVSGIYTLAINEVSADGAFTVKLMVQE